MEKILEIKKLSLKFGKEKIFNEVSFPIFDKNVTAIVGPSGCGKSSFLTCLNRMIELEPEARLKGEVLFHKRPLGEYSVMDVRRKIAMVYQKPTPFPFSIEKNFQIPLQEVGGASKLQWQNRMAEVLDLVGLWDEVKDRLNTPANQLSGGQQQRLCIARALALQPEILLMDEPCSALDPISSRRIEQLIGELKNIVTVVIVTHNLAQAKRVSQNLAFFWWCHGAGCLMETGTTEEIFMEPRHSETFNYIQSERV